MAEAKELKTVSYQLNLNEEEARYLKVILQNPCGPIPIEHESGDCGTHRCRIFNVLKVAGVM